MVKHLTVVKNEAKKEAEIFLYGIIGNLKAGDNNITAKDFQKELSNIPKDIERVNVRINGPGGSVWDGLAIANAIQASKKEIHTYNDGLAASMLAIILASAKDGNRHAAKGSITMFHSASSGTYGNAAGLRDAADMLDVHDKVLAGYISDATKMPFDDVLAKYFNGKNHYLTAQEAEALGIVKVEDYAAKPIPTNLIENELSFDEVAAFYNENDEEEISPSLMAKIKAQIQSLINPKNTEMKFTKLEALAKLGAENLTDELVEAVKTELAEAEIEGVTIVKDTEMVDLATKAEKLVTVEATLATKEADMLVKDALIADLQAQLKAPADEGGNPDGVVGNEIPGGEPKNEFRTSVDDELAKYN